MESSRDLLNQRYQLEETVGEGGMAIVWRARDLLLDRKVAVKILRDQYAGDPEFLERFRTEARSAAALNHPCIVGVYDVGEDRGRHYLVMEYVPGRDLKTVIRADAPFAPRRAVNVATDLARAVAAAHAIGLVHRDIKPQNVLVCPDGQMKMADFGIARAVAGSGLTEPGIVMGTVHYIAPEQAAGEPASPASDVYSLGVVLYEMLTGKVPFVADSSVGAAMKILYEDAVPVEEVNPRVPAQLAAIVARAMARRPEARFGSARELAEALESLAQESQQTTGSLDSVPVGARRPRQRWPASDQAASSAPLLDRTGVVLGLVAALAVAGLIPLWLAVLARADAAPAAPARQGATAEAPGAATATIDSTAAVSGMLVPVPGVVGETLESAQARLREGGLGSTEPREFSDLVPAGLVMRQRPGAGESVPRGSIVELVVSQGPAVRVPSADGDYASVAAALVAAGFEPVRRDRWSGAAGHVDKVLGIDPPPGSLWPRASQVQVTVDSGSWLPLSVDFEGNVHLRGADVPRAAVAPGDTLTLVAEWQAVAPIDSDYSARALLVASDGATVAQAELPLADRPSSTWPPAERMTSGRFELLVDPGLAGGEYGLWLEVLSPGDPSSALPVRSRGLAERAGVGRVLLLSVQVG